MDDLTNLEEYKLGTKPNAADSDGDGRPDGLEDANQNGILNFGESNPANLDTDGGGINDLIESTFGTDFTNDLDYPEPSSVGDFRVIGNLVSEAATPSYALVWKSVLGKTYQIEKSETLESLSWTTVASGLPSVGNRTSYVYTDADLPPLIRAKKRYFFRIIEESP
jgi:hypothetical protein